MAVESPELQARLAFGRAFLTQIEKGDTTLATLFARAFVVQGAVINGVVRQGGARWLA